MSKDTSDLDKPATQGDLEIWGGNLAFQISEVETTLTKVQEEQLGQGKKIDQMQETLQEIQQTQKKQDGVLESLLSVTQMLAGQFTEVKETPERIENHEERITGLEVKVRILQK